MPIGNITTDYVYTLKSNLTCSTGYLDLIFHEKLALGHANASIYFKKLLYMVS